MKAKVIVTKKCNRRCRGCSTRALGIVDKVSFEDLFQYEEIHITGGEPMLMSDRCVEMVHRLRLSGYTGKIYLYTADARRVGTYWAAGMLIDEVDGVVYTVHNHSDKEKLKDTLRVLRRLDKYLNDHAKERAGKRDRLRIDSALYDDEYVKTLSYKWAEVAPLKWERGGLRELPEDEVYVFYDLGAEGNE